MTGGKFKSEEKCDSPPTGESRDGPVEAEVTSLAHSTNSTDLMEESVWIFGYGSLLWKVNFPYHDKVVGYVKGYSRRFWQGSTDHRGIPGAPGRVVTLVEQEQGTTWGIAYRVDPRDISEVMAYLNHREKGGYTTKELLFHPKPNLSREAFTTLVYIGTEANPMYLGPAPLLDIAKQIVMSKGPSGCNTEYALNLAEEMRRIAPGVEDRHLFSLEGHIKEILEEIKAGEVQECTCQPCGHHRHTILSS